MKVAVVGSGVSGLGAVWVRLLLVRPTLLSYTLTSPHYHEKALNEHSEHEVHLFEADSRPGGHANTVEYTCKETGLTTAVDT